MILDFSSDKNAFDFEIVDAESGLPLPMDSPYCDLWYADDEAGIIRYYAKGKDGVIPLAWASDPSTPIPEDETWRRKIKEGDKIIDVTPETCPCWKEEKRAIRIVRKELVNA